MKKRKHIFRIMALVMSGLIVLSVGTILCIDAYVKHSTRSRILPAETVGEREPVDCILVLGCLVRQDGEPSSMLEDRLKQGVALYRAGAAKKLLMSGDHGREDYNEVETMKQFAIQEGVVSSDVFMDHAGFSTYESLYRAKEVFQAKRIIIVTQQYHLYRALYIADKLGIEAYGVSSDYRSYYGQSQRELREVLARTKDFFYMLVQPKPTYLGEPIPISGNGDATND